MENSKGEESLNIRIRITVLVLLCCQNAGHALLTRYSQGILRERYSSTEVVLVGEFMKLAVSGYLAITDKTESDAQGGGVYKLLWLILNARKIVVLVILYALSNLLSYYALARVDASAYTVLLQLKILTTAAFAVAILGRNISMTKWRALILLVIGCILVASPAYNPPLECDNTDDDKARLLSVLYLDPSSSSSIFRSAAYSDPSDALRGADAAGLASGLMGAYSDWFASATQQLGGSYVGRYLAPRNQATDQSNAAVPIYEVILGFGAILAMNMISGFASIYFESMLKKPGEKITIWERNYQLAFYSIWLLVGIISYEMMDPSVENLTFFRGWTMNTVLISIIQASGGLLVAATLKYADSILKTLATSGSIVLSAILGRVLLDGTLDIFIGLGCVSTILAITNYTFADS